MPFEDDLDLRLLITIRNNEWKFDENCGVSELAKELVIKLLVKDPSLRLTAEQALSDPFFSSDE